MHADYIEVYMSRESMHADYIEVYICHGYTSIKAVIIFLFKISLGFAIYSTDLYGSNLI